MNNLVSIIIPAYNRQAYIAECLDSVLAQSYTQLEIIVIDDGSTDDTLEIARDYAKKDSRIKLLVGTHQGVSAARNLGLDTAEGEYVFFLDTDDIIYPKLLETLIEGMESSGAKMGGTRVNVTPEYMWQEKAEKVRNGSKKGEMEYFTFEETLNQFFTANTPLSMIGGVIMRRDWIGETRFCTDLTVGEDYYFIYENFIKGADVSFLKQKWYFNRLHDSNSSWDYSYKGFLTRFRRRELVWKSEERLGRNRYSNMQKSEILPIYLTCVQKSGVFSSDGKQMRKMLKSYRSTLLPAMNIKWKLAFCASLYLPFTAVVINKLK